MLSDAELLVNVGCCYHFLSDQTGESKILFFGYLQNCNDVDTSEDSKGHGFPMSQLVQNGGLHLDYRPKNLAAQALYRWSRQVEQDLNVFVKHHFRAILQVILKERGWIKTESDLDFFVVGHLHKDTFNSFPVYARACLEKFKLGEQVTDDELREYEAKFEGQQDLLAFCWTLRALMSQVLESLILLDRQLYLEEYGFQARLFPLFDPYESPRNMVLFASKSETH